MTTATAELYASCDQYGFSHALGDAERAVLGQLRTVLETTVRPLLAEYWEKGEFPHQVLPDLIALDLMAPSEIAATGAAPSALYAGFRNFELARTDASIVTAYNAQSDCSAPRSPVAQVRHRPRSWTRRSAVSSSPGCSR
jgi:glutaryl-CoA dehydrogenase